MTNLAHIADTALLLTFAYLAGCVLGYLARWILYAAIARGKATSAPLSVSTVDVPTSPRPRTNAARLAAAAATDIPPPIPEIVPVVQPLAEPQAKAAPSDLELNTGNGAADNLKLIKGIGPKIEVSLHGLGVFQFHQIANWTSDEIDRVDSQLAFKGRIRRDKWVDQARELSGKS